MPQLITIGETMAVVMIAGNQAVIPSQDGIHIPKSCAEYRAFLFKPSWFIKAADISRTSSCITDHDDPAKLIQH